MTLNDPSPDESDGTPANTDNPKLKEPNPNVEAAKLTTDIARDTFRVCIEVVAREALLKLWEHWPSITADAIAWASQFNG